MPAMIARTLFLPSSIATQYHGSLFVRHKQFKVKGNRAGYKHETPVHFGIS
jgi:hypothetical protein